MAKVSAKVDMILIDLDQVIEKLVEMGSYNFVVDLDLKDFLD